MRVGMGYDVHKLVEGRPLILGGVEDSAYTGTARTFGCGCACACNHGCTAWCCSTRGYRKTFSGYRSAV